MSKESLSQFVEEVGRREELRAKISNQINSDTLITLGAEQGFEFNAEDIEQALSKLGSQRTIDLFR
ncbi:MAG: Nif11-like leader peptide family natural product precursor [Pseudomonadota bacterium]|nr:Nif11-like leader peptide family natural product precursor [Pseudomonadota bacterium]